MESAAKAISELEYCVARYGKEDSFTFAAYQALKEMKAMQARIDELSKDAAMVDWMQENYLCADFRYGDPVCEAIVIEMPKGSSVCGDLRIDIGNAMKD